MSKWIEVGDWLKENAGTGAALIGSLISGNVPGAVAAGVSLVSSATGTDDPVQALQQLQTNPETMVRLKELSVHEDENIRNHLRVMYQTELEDKQKEHSETQQTIRNGDNALDKAIRWVRPEMAQQSWVATIAYCIGCFGVEALTGTDLFSIYLAGIISGPAFAYMGLRQIGKGLDAWVTKQGNS
jgi:hypothetical protein